MAEYLQVTITFSTREEAKRIGRTLVEARLAACVQVSGPIESTYWWQGRLEESREWLCTAKTTRDAYPKLEETVRRLHTYEVPEVLATPVAMGSASYLEWLGLQLRQG